MACTTCKRALLKEHGDENGNCAECAREKAKEERVRVRSNIEDAKEIVGTRDGEGRTEVRRK